MDCNSRLLAVVKRSWHPGIFACMATGWEDVEPHVDVQAASSPTSLVPKPAMSIPLLMSRTSPLHSRSGIHVTLERLILTLDRCLLASAKRSVVSLNLLGATEYSMHAN